VTSPSASGTLQSAFICSLRLLPPLARNLIAPIAVNAQPCPVRDLYRNVFLGQDPSPIAPKMGRIALGVKLTSVAADAKLINQLLGDMNVPKNVSVHATGLTALAAKAYENLTGRILLFNLVPLAAVALVLLLVYREPRRALLPVLPAAVAAGWSSLVFLGLGRLPGGAGSSLGTLNPLTVVLGALVIALGTEFGVVLLQRFYEERARGLDPDQAAGAALHGVGRAIVVSALTLGAGFAVLALSGLFPGGLPLVADFGLAVLVDLALAVGAVFLVMLPLAVAVERSHPVALPATPARDSFEHRFQAEPEAGAISRRAQKRARDAERAEARRLDVGRAAVLEAPAADEVDEDLDDPELDAAAVGEDEVEPVAPDAGAWGRPSRPAPPAVAAADAPPPAPSTRSDLPARPPVTAEAAAPPPRFPGVSGRRRPEAPAPGATVVTPAPHRVPGVSGRRRLSPPELPTPPSPQPPTDPAPRRMPGGVTRRRVPTAAEPTRPPEPTRAPEPAGETPAQPGMDTPPRSRRRRPPPWVRRNLPPRDE
jgi:hypothetical protein